MEEKQTLICDKCQVEMVDADVQFSYLNRSFRHKVPRCPKCGQVFISEELVQGRMSEVEALLEEKQEQLDGNVADDEEPMPGLP